MHRGIHAWTVYTLLALLLALMAHRYATPLYPDNMFTFPLGREGLPLTMKSCFYPLIGDKIFGWPGDLVRPSKKAPRNLGNIIFLVRLTLSQFWQQFGASVPALGLVQFRSTRDSIS